MGKSTSCLKLISCAGGASKESNETGPVDQTKNLKRKKGWRFNERSSAGLAVTNSVIAKTPSLEQKENIQSGASETIVSDKHSALQWDEKSQPPPQVAANLIVPNVVLVSETEKQPATTVANDESVTETEKQSATAAASSHGANDVSVRKIEKQSEAANSSVTDGLTESKTWEYEAVVAVHESDVVIIQSAVRGFLVRKELKSIIKLQAVVRGHLVRCQAVGALRCVQAITKMQVLVRAARTRKDGTPKSRPEVTYTSMTDLLKSSFARQLLESSPKSKPINIKCDPLSRDSSWVWLNRWMSLASPGAVDDLNARTEKVQEVEDIEFDREEKTIDKEEEKKIDYLFNEENEIFLGAKDFASPFLNGDSKMDVTEEANPANSSKLNLTNSDVDSHSVSSLEKQILNVTDEVETVESAAEKDSVNHPADAREISQHDIDVVREKSESKSEQDIELENELHNESELVSAPLSAVSPVSVPQDVEVVEPILATHLAIVYDDTVSAKDEAEDFAMDYISATQNAETEEVVPHCYEFDLNLETAASNEDDIVINHKEQIQPENSGIQVGESECGTELSITSTLDSPDGMEIEPMKVEFETVELAGSESHEDAKFNSAGDELENETGSLELGKSDFVNGKSAEYATANKIGEDEEKLETNVATLQLQLDATEENETKTSASDLPTEPKGGTERSHQTSPVSQVTFSESQGTPTSQVSVSSKSKITKKPGSIKKRTILSAVRKSPLTDSDAKNSSEKLPKDQKSVKRRTSFGSPNPEVSDQEHWRDSSISSSLPSYMQATQSARAKANAGISPHSSPDVVDKDVFLRKRHSISGIKDKPNSPRLQRTTSQAQSGTKSNGTSPLERKWQR